MQINTRKYLYLTIGILFILLLLYLDDTFYKTTRGFYTYEIEIIKILLGSAITYKAAKFLIRKFDLYEKFPSIAPNRLFIGLFFVLNFYIFYQYVHRIIYFKIIKHEVRTALNQKLKLTNRVGWGFEADSLNYREYAELNRCANLPKLPSVATNINAKDWFEIDFSRGVEFSTPPDFDPNEFYERDSYILENLNKGIGNE